MSSSLNLLFESELACFANSGVMLQLEFLQTTHANLDIFVANWASYFAVIDCKIAIKILEASYLSLLIRMC
jgi:hypothetical protein